MSATVSFNYAVTGLSTLKGNFINSYGQIVKASDGSAITNNSTNRPNASVVGSDMAVAGTYLFTMPAGAASGPYTLKIWLDPTWADNEQPIGLSDTLSWNGTAFVGTAVAGSTSNSANTVTVGGLRTMLQDSARNAGLAVNFASGKPYTLTTADMVLQSCTSHFQRETKYVKQVATGTIASGTNTLTLSATGFHTERILNVWAKPADSSNSPANVVVSIVNYDEILDHRRCTTTGSGHPCKIGFISTDGSDGESDNDVTFDWNVYVRYWPTITGWAAGDTSGGVAGTIINLPFDIASEIVRTYGVFLLQRNQPQQIKEAVVANLKAQYDAYVNSKLGSGGTGERSVRRHSVRETRYERRW